MEPPSHFAPFTMEHTPATSNGHTQAPVLATTNGVLHVEVHQARNLHNICIYAKQDVYIKLTLFSKGTSEPPTVFFTDIVDKGGKDPVFNQKFTTPSVLSSCVLRCEVFMASKLRDYLQDQLLGQVSIPLATLVGRGKYFEEFGLSSTELFHSPAGIICLTLEFLENCEGVVSSLVPSASDVSVESSTEEPLVFTDPADAEADKELVSDFIRRKPGKNIVGDGICTGPPYLKLPDEFEGELSVAKLVEAVEAADGTTKLWEEREDTTLLPELEESETTTKEAEAAVVEDIKKLEGEVSVVEQVTKVTTIRKKIEIPAAESSVTDSVTPSSKLTTEENGVTPRSKGEQGEPVAEFTPKVELEPEPRIMQDEIVDMYMKSMQQFSDALSRMQLPVDENGLIKVPSTESTSSGKSESDRSSQSGEKSGETGKKSSQRVFYGSRAFF